LAWQASLLAGATPSIDATFASAERVELDPESWIDVVPGWLAGGDEVFAALLATPAWKQHERIMWGNRVPEPRLSAGWKESGAASVARVLVQARAALSRRYELNLNSGWLNLYRDGRDSVAWHRDRISAAVPHPLVAILTLGSTRGFLVRPYGGGPSIRFDPAPGDLLVTGGRTQRQWEHCVPKSASATGPRVSVTFRPSLSVAATRRRMMAG